jgi:phosphomannomutase
MVKKPWRRKNKVENIVMFDMDGTLTPARKPMEPKMQDALLELSKVAKIGIVTGSGYDYVMQQCGSFLKSNRDLSNFTIMPCNGTQKYIWDKSEWENDKWVKHSSLDMRNHIGEDNFRFLMYVLTERLYITSMYNYKKFPATGHFISYRGSLLNWCPVGRLANDEDRKVFIKYDKENNVRQQNLEIFRGTRLSDILSFSMGGNTSIDIYPKGWDKTYALNHCEGLEPWFIGDRCTAPDGNDKPLYDKIKETKPHQAFEVKTTDDTIEIIKDIIEKLTSGE